MTVRKKPAQPGDLIVVTWHDAVKHGDGEHVPRHRAYVMRTVGWLLHNDGEGVSLAGELCHSDDTWRDENFIPAGMVQGIEVIKPKGG